MLTTSTARESTKVKEMHLNASYLHSVARTGGKCLSFNTDYWGSRNEGACVLCKRNRGILHGFFPRVADVSDENRTLPVAVK